MRKENILAERSNEAQAIENLQRYLRQLSFDEEQIPAPPVDGIFESDTQRALVAFQEINGISPTGVADRETWELLYAAYRTSLARNTPPRAVALFPRSPNGYLLARGTVGAPVTALQYMLVELTHSYSAWEGLTVSGIFDEATEAAVTAFQLANALPPSGTVDKATWNAVTDQHNTLLGQFPIE